MADENPTRAEQKIIDLLTKIAGPGDAGDDKKEQAADTKRSRKRHLKALRDNGLALVGLSTGMFSLSKLVGNQLEANKSLAQSLGKTAQASEGVTAVSKRFITGQQGFEQKIKLFADAVELGMSNFADKTLQFGMQLKILGVQNKTAFQLIRANTQGLGMVEEASLMLTNQLVSTAAENKDSISGLIDAINGMKDAMVDTTVELGPKAALNAQKIAAMMSQNNSELQESSAKFVKSFLAGSDGYMKAAKMGVQFTGQESTAEMARKFETILEKMSMLQSGRQGAGSQFLFDALERSFGLSREDFNLQTQIGTSIEALKESNVRQLSKASATINFQQLMLNSLDGIQTIMQKLLQEVTRELTGWKDWITKNWNDIWANPSRYLRVLKDRASAWADREYPWLKTTLYGIGIAVSIGLLSKLMAPIKWLWRMLSGSKLLKMAGGLFGGGGGGGMKQGLLPGFGRMAEPSRWSKMIGGLSKLGPGIKSLAKRLPITGAIIGTGAALISAYKGNWADAGVHLASGALTFAGPVGVAAGIALESGYHMTGAREAIMGNSPDASKIAADTEEGLDVQRQSLEVQERTLDFFERQAPIRGWTH